MSKGLLDDKMLRTWKRVCDQSDKERLEQIERGTYKPCCDENIPCGCQTFSPNMPSPEEVKMFKNRTHPLSVNPQREFHKEQTIKIMVTKKKYKQEEDG